MTSVTADPPGTRPVGGSITLTATATGGAPPLQYKWWVWNGSAWSVARDWAVGNNTPTPGSDRLTWTPPAPGNYEVQAWVRNSGVTANTFDAWGRLSYTVTAAPTPSLPTMTSVTANRTGAQPVNRSITLTATATGGAPPLQYKWWVWNGSAWSVARDWGTGNTLTWTPRAPGNYELQAWVRNSGVTANTFDAWGRMGFTVVPQAQDDD
jgi:alpha-amylase